MRSFGFRVVPANPDDGSGVPIAVAGQIMVDVQKVITDIGCMIVRLELRIQNEIPQKLVRKFDLTIGGDTDDGLNSKPSEGNDDALETALDALCATLDFLGKGAVGTWMTDTFEDDRSRAIIARDLIDLTDHLNGYALEYGPEDQLSRFEGLDREKILPYTVMKNEVSAAVGVISRDPIKRNHWNISNDQYIEPITFDRNIVPTDIPSFASAGPVIVIGIVNRGEKGHILSIDKISGCYTIPELKFHRITASNGDRILLNPIVAKTGYDPDTDTWSLKNDILGVNVTKPSWDECILTFHEYVIFLFENYVDSKGTFEGEEKDIQEYLLSLLPA